jgi:dCTP deaminase
MSVLSDCDIKSRLGDSVVINPFNLANVNTSSYDVTLGRFYFIEHKPSFWPRRPIYNIWEESHVNRIWGKPKSALPAREVFRNRFFKGWDSYHGIRDDDLVILLPPKHTILAHTEEFIGGRLTTKGPPITTMMKARSSYGRNFIEVCKCAGYGDVGYINRWTMEITNNSRFYSIPLVVGRRIAQIVFLETGQSNNDYSTTGKYQESGDIEEIRRRWRAEDMLPRLYNDRGIVR